MSINNNIDAKASTIIEKSKNRFIYLYLKMLVDYNI